MKKLFAVILSLSLIIAPVPAVHAAGDGYAKQILGISNGVMGATILTKCKMGTMQLSVLAYMAGGLVFVASEIAGGKAQGNKLKGMSADLENLKANMTEGGDYQKAAIDAQIKDEKATLEHIQKRRKWMMATKAVYAAATALAILENWWRLPYPAGINKPDKAGCQHMEGSHKPLVQTIIAAYSTFLGAGGDMKSTAMMMAAKTIAQFAFKIEMGTAVASKAIKIMDNALGRIAFFAAATAIVQVIDSGLAKEEKKTKQKIADLEKVKAQFTGTGTSIAEGSSNSNLEGGANSGSGGTNAGSGSVNASTNGNYAIKELPKGITAENKTCYSNASGATEYSESACKNPIQFNRPKFDMNMNLPTLVAGVNAATDLGQAFADGDMAKADLAAASLNSMAGKIDSIRDGLMNKLNDQLKAEGKKPIDVNGELQRQIDDLNKGLNQANPGSGNNTMASLGLDALKSGPAEISENSLSGNKTDGNGITTAGTEKSVEMPAPDLNLNSLSESDLTGSGAGSSDIDHMLDDKSGKLAALESLDKSGANATEIAPDSDVSLFKQVSNRYFLNYGKMFERKKINPPEAAPSP